jgi:rod shape-determining protein MreD
MSAAHLHSPLRLPRFNHRRCLNIGQQLPKRVRSLRTAKTLPISVPITYTSGEQIEVYRFSIPVTIGVPLVALFLQAFLPRRLPFFSIFDLPLLVTIFFAMARRNPISGLLTGAAIGLVQDMLGAYPIGIYGIAKTVVGYGASSLGAKLDVENAGARFLVTLGFYLVHQAVYFAVARGMVNLTMNWSWSRGIIAGLANALLGVALYFALDKFKQRA